ncbi:MAG: hypothetical protein ACI9N1_000326 [Flavobacteriales bacterium]|jgi:hypothetical protein
MKISSLYTFLLIMFALSELSMNAQTIVIREEVPESFEEEDHGYGPNRRTYKHPFMEYSLSSGGFDHSNKDIADIKTLRSFGLASGFRTYTNLNKLMSLTLDTRFDYSQYSLDYPESFVVKLPVPNEDLKRAHYFFVKYGISAGLQFNLKPKRGNQLGKFIKIGALGNVNLMQRFGAKYELSDASIAKYEKVTLTHIRYVNRWSASIEAGYGNTFIYLFARYRMTDIMKQDQLIPISQELPRLTFGFQFYTSGI